MTRARSIALRSARRSSMWLKMMVGAMALVGLVFIGDTSFALATGSVRGHVMIKRGRRYKKDHSGVVIFLRDVPDSEPTPQKEHVVIDQTDKTFHPHVTVIPTGTTVDFPNNDRVFHNVFSLSRARKFDLGLYKSGTSKSVTFEQAGVVDIYCNIHPEMSAKVLVVGTTHYAVTGPDGAFALDGVPPGTYSYMAWQADGEPVEGQVRVEAGGMTALTLELREDRWTRDRHTRKDGTPYGRYK